MADKLVIDQPENYGGYRIGWFLKEEQEMGAYLGEEIVTLAKVEKAKPDDWEHLMANYVAGQTQGVTRNRTYGYEWESKKDAQAALKEIKLALAQKKGKPWPAWALTAKAAGWKPPAKWEP